MIGPRQLRRASAWLRAFLSAMPAPRLDPLLVLLLLLLMTLSMTVMGSVAQSEPGLYWRHAARLGIGLLAMVAVAAIPPRALRSSALALYAVGLVALVVVAAIGVGPNVRSWLVLGGLRFQPAEIMKLAVPLMVAWVLHARPLPPQFGDTLICAVLIGIPGALIAIQPDLGTALLVSSSGIAAVYAAGLSWRWFAGSAVVALGSAPLIWPLLLEHQRRRIVTMFNPEADPLGAGWNLLQSKIAIGSGGLWGKGYGEGTQATLDFLPEHHTDFILAVVAEEFGFVGVLLLFVLYAAILLRGLSVALNAVDLFGRIVGISFCAAFFAYVVVNAAMMSGLLPVVGIPLPLMSYGGSSAITLLISFGLIQGLRSPAPGLNRPWTGRR